MDALTPPRRDLARDPIPAVDDDVSIRTDIRPTLPEEIWRERLKRERRKHGEDEAEAPHKPPRDPDHAIDEYA
jgi:hypothetical protein